MSQTQSSERASLERRGVPEHLTKEQPNRSPSQYDTSGRREFWCKECRLRVTAGVELKREYGHKRDCDHYIGYNSEK